MILKRLAAADTNILLREAKPEAVSLPNTYRMWVF
jgi:hypothetical protein